jgi:hypothetical protein
MGQAQYAQFVPPDRHERALRTPGAVRATTVTSGRVLRASVDLGGGTRRNSMHAVVINATITHRDALPTTLTELVPVVSGAPGFVASYWILLGQDQGISILVFDTEDSASLQALATQVAGSDAARIDSVDVGEVTARA